MYFNIKSYQNDITALKIIISSVKLFHPSKSAEVTERRMFLETLKYSNNLCFNNESRDQRKAKKAQNPHTTTFELSQGIGSFNYGLAS